MAIQIIFTDYARNWGTNSITLDSNGLNYQGDDDTFDVEYTTDGQSVDIVYSGATNGWIPTLDEAVANVPTAPPNENGIFGFGNNGATKYGVTNLVSNLGVVATDVSAVVGLLGQRWQQRNMVVTKEYLVLVILVVLQQ